MDGDPGYVADTLESYHTVSFQLHEDAAKSGDRSTSHRHNKLKFTAGIPYKQEVGGSSPVNAHPEYPFICQGTSAFERGAR